MLSIWSGKTPPIKVTTVLSPVTQNHPQLPVQVVPVGQVPAETSLLLSLGSEALKMLQEAKSYPKNRTITSLRTVPSKFQNKTTLISYSADIGEIDHRYHVDLLTDAALAVRYCETGSFDPQVGEYKWVDDFLDLINEIESQSKLTEKPVDVMLDLETVGLDPYAKPTATHPGAYIVTIQVSRLLGEGYAIRFDSKEDSQRLREQPLWGQVNWLLTSSQVRLKGANLKYDLHWLAVHGGFKCKNFAFDTTIVGSLLDENRSNSLDVHVKIYAIRGGGYSDEFDRTVDKSRMDLALKNSPETFLKYACGDVDYGLEVSQNLKTELLKDEALTGFYCNILHPAARAFEKIEQGGVLVDMDAYQALQVDLEMEQLRIIKEASKILGGRIVYKHLDQTKVGGINLKKPALLCDFLFSKMGLNLKPKMFTKEPDADGIKRPSTAEDHLLEFADDPKAKDFIGLISEYGSASKTYNTYVLGFQKHLRSDGRFHPTYYLFVGNKDEGEGGANTGRLSCHDPAFQTVPKHTKWAKRIRRCFPAPPGYVVVERDYSQGELRVIACISHCKNMIQVYKENKDLHTKTAASAAKMLYDALVALEQADIAQYEAIRQKGKAGNFGLVFGMAAAGFVDYARKNYRVAFTLDEAEDFRNSFFGEYPELLDYHKKFKAFAHQFGYVRTPLGRVRHLPLINSPNREYVAQAERQSINSPVQGTLTDMLIWSVALEMAAGIMEQAPGFGSVHDSVYNYVLEDKVDTIVPKMLEIQENLPFEKVGWNPVLQFTADAKFGKNMADLEKFKRH